MQVLCEDLSSFTDEQLLDTIQKANAAYRSGEPIVSDDYYDNTLIAELVKRDPNHPFLNTVEPEPVTGKTVKLPERMLSTQKAYTLQDLANWYQQVWKAANEQGISDIEIRTTPKLDGFAAYDAGPFKATRGDGFEGTDITHAFSRGLGIYKQPSASAVMGKGEIVVDKEYFERHLSDNYENTRNVIAAVIKESELEPEIGLAIAKGGVEFIPFNMITGFHTYSFDKDVLTGDNIDNLWDHMLNHCPFDTDGLVFEAVHPRIKEAMGHTNHHYRWQIAYKRNTEFHDCRVTSLTWQTARTGRITPVVNIEPTRIGGVTVSNVTGHHAGNVISKGIGEGAVVKVTRAGQVIPHIVEVVSSDELVPVSYPLECPCCGAGTVMDGDNLTCPNTVNCSAQFAGTIEHFFKTIGDCDGFGPAVTEKLCDLISYNGISPTIANFVVNISVTELVAAGIGQGTATNLVNALDTRRQKPLEDWKFLAAFGIPGIGRGVSEKLLSHFTLQEVIRGVSTNDIQAVEGIGSVLADSLINGLGALDSDIAFLSGRFNLTQTKGTTPTSSPVAGKTIVFTGTMQQGSRSEMEANAKALGAKVSGSVSSKTDYLIIGENVGANKTDAAKKHGTTILTEQQYIDLIAA